MPIMVAISDLQDLACDRYLTPGHVGKPALSLTTITYTLMPEDAHSRVTAADSSRIPQVDSRLLRPSNFIADRSKYE